VSNSCEYCKQQYSPIRVNQRFCSRQCRNRSWGGVPEHKVLSCVQCKAEFQQKRSNQKCCSVICNNVWNRRNRDWGEHQRLTHRAWVERNRDKVKSFQMKNKAKRYGLSVYQLESLLAKGCYAPGCGATGTGRTGLHIDHDHDCCPGTYSCGRCVRGALCGRHNVYLGHLEKDPLFAMWAVRQAKFMVKIRREA
jgi:hypothetical protein